MKKIKKKTPWSWAASRIVKTELTKRDLTYKGLCQKLERIGVEENENNVKSKLERGSFNVVFFLQVLQALEIKELVLDDIVFTQEKLR